MNPDPVPDTSGGDSPNEQLQPAFQPHTHSESESGSGPNTTEVPQPQPEPGSESNATKVTQSGSPHPSEDHRILLHTIHSRMRSLWARLRFALSAANLGDVSNNAFDIASRCYSDFRAVALSTYTSLRKLSRPQAVLLSLVMVWLLHLLGSFSLSQSRYEQVEPESPRQDDKNKPVFIPVAAITPKPMSTFHEWHENWINERLKAVAPGEPLSVYHIGGFEKLDDSTPEGKRALNKRKQRFDPNTFRGRLSNYVSPKSCVGPCADRKNVVLPIPKEYRYVLSKNKVHNHGGGKNKSLTTENNLDTKCTVSCLYQQYVLVIPSFTKLILQNFTVPANCTRHPKRAVCPLPIPTDCVDHCWNEWHVSTHATPFAPLVSNDKNVATWKWTDPIAETHFFDLRILNKRPFKIVALYPDHLRPGLIQVVSYYLPNTIRPDGCNRLYCIYEYPNGDLERFQSVLGDVSVTYCPVPSRPGPQTTLRLTYDHWTLSLPYPLVVEPFANDLPFVFMSICSIVKKEGPNLQEWFEFHMMMGYERFILYDNNPADEPDVLMEEVVNMYPEQVVIRKWPHRHAQTEALTDCIIRFGQRTEWMTFIDVDEFLVPNRKFHDIREPLKYYVPGLSYLQANWVTFGPCGNETKKPTEVVMDVCNNVTLRTSNSPKSTFRPQEAISMQGYSPHYIRLRKDVGGYPRSKSSFVNDLFHVYHYRYRSWSEFVSRRKGPTAGRVMVWDKKRFHEEWNVGIKNSRPLQASENDIARFIPELKRRLGYVTDKKKPKKQSKRTSKNKSEKVSRLRPK